MRGGAGKGTLSSRLGRLHLHLPYPVRFLPRAACWCCLLEPRQFLLLHLQGLVSGLLGRAPGMSKAGLHTGRVHQRHQTLENPRPPRDSISQRPARRGLGRCQGDRQWPRLHAGKQAGTTRPGRLCASVRGAHWANENRRAGVPAVGLSLAARVRPYRWSVLGPAGRGQFPGGYRGPRLAARKVLAEGPRRARPAHAS